MRAVLRGHRTQDVLAQLPALRRYARVLTRNQPDAEDLVHDALVRAYERHTTFRPKSSIRLWLISILHNVFIDGVRRRSAEQRHRAEAASLHELWQCAGQEATVRLHQIKQAFLTLPDEQRAILHLVAIEGLSYQEAAETLGIPIGTVMSRLGRARSALRSFEDDYPANTHPSAVSSKPQTRRLRLVGGEYD